MDKPLNVFTFLFYFSILALNLGCSAFGIRTVEEANYKIHVEDNNKEIRVYSPRIIAKTSISGEYKTAQKEAFRILADYIFGKNKLKQDIAMTAPVTQENQSTKIAMTAPVTQEKENNTWTLSFAMPAKFQTISELPQPIDERIELIQKPGGIYAVVGFTWLTDEEKNQKMAHELLKWLEVQNQYRPISIPFYAGYDPPWTIPFLRRQEMMVEVESIDGKIP